MGFDVNFLDMFVKTESLVKCDAEKGWVKDPWYVFPKKLYAKIKRF